MKMKPLAVLLLAGIWGVGSWWWYTCKVKGFCGAEKHAVEQTAGMAALESTAADSATDEDKTGSTDNSAAGQAEPATPATDDSTGKNAQETADAADKTDAPDTAEATQDDDGDGVPNDVEKAMGTNPALTDSDGDGINDAVELAREPKDTDGDGKIDALDSDDDNDGIPTAEENPDPNGDGKTDDAADQNNNHVADYLEAIPDTVASAGTSDSEAGTQTAPGIPEDGVKPDTEEDADAAGDADKTTAEASETDGADNKAATGDADKVTLTTNESAPDTGAGIKPATLRFPFRSAEPQLADSTAEYFDKVVAFLKASPDAKVTLVGHTDSVGNDNSNKRLGLQRADMIRDILVKRGAPKGQIETSSKGETEPVADNKTEAGREENRRVELTPVK